MTESNRRDFLRMSGAALAGAAFAGPALAQTTQAAGRDVLMHKNIMTTVVPGAVDASGNWTLPPLPYDPNALEPAIDEQTMRIHHGRHHQGYVNGLKNCEEKLAQARQAGDYSLVEYWTNKLSFNAGGHFLHCIFWDSMGPDGGGNPGGMLRQAIERDFGSLEAFKGQFSAAAKGVEGSGWGLLGMYLASGTLGIMQCQNQNLLSPWAFVPLLGVDVWEHAYYLKYQNNRGQYVDNWWNVVNWRAVERRHALLLGQTPEPEEPPRPEPRY